MNYLQNHVEALIFCATVPVSLPDLQRCLIELTGTNIPPRQIRAALDALQQKYDTPEFAFELREMGGGYLLLTKPDYRKSVEILLAQKARRKLSPAALETLSIIAYKQPITKSEVEAIRGVNCDYAIRKLLEKDLLTIKGKATTPGRPLLYGTSRRFMRYFGISAIHDLPLPEDLAQDELSDDLDQITEQEE
ncbi:MAG: SMC-Scp complex subunit ScpB [Bernardetiaceae bacterium]